MSENQEGSDVLMQRALEAQGKRTEENPQEELQEQEQEQEQEEESQEQEEEQEGQEQQEEESEEEQDESEEEESEEEDEQEDEEESGVRTSLFDDDEEEEEQESDSDKEKAEMPKEVAEKLAEYESLKKDKFIEAYLAETKNGGDPLSFIEKLNPEKPIKTEGLSDYEIHKANVSKHLSGDDLEDEMEYFESITSPFEKKRIVSADKEEIEKHNGNLYSKLGEFTEKSVKQQETQKQNVDTAMSTLFNITNDLKGVNYRGVVLTEDKIEAIKKHVTQVNAFLRPDGTYDIKEAVKYAIYKLHGKDLEKVANKKVIENANKEKKKLINDTIRPSKNKTVAKRTSKLSLDQKKKSAEDFIKERFKSNL